MKTFSIAVMPGDGIGKEIMPPCIDLLKQAAATTGGFLLEFKTVEAGADLYLKTGIAFPEENFQKAATADAILLGAMGLPNVRYPDGREVGPQLELRERLELYAGVRPVKARIGIPPVLAHPRYLDIDFILVRESTEGMFALRTQGIVENDQEARDTLVITRKGSERLFDFCFHLARKRKIQGRQGKVTCVDKANVFRSFGFFRKIYDERAQQFPDIIPDYCYVDATALSMIKRPWEFDVMVMENLFGDILSDLGAALMGGMGVAPSADIGDKHAVFQPCHGTAPDIAGQGKANPLAMFLSGAMMLDWLADMSGIAEVAKAAMLIEQAIDEVLASNEALPIEFGGTAGTEAITKAVSDRLGRLCT